MIETAAGRELQYLELVPEWISGEMKVFPALCSGFVVRKGFLFGARLQRAELDPAAGQVGHRRRGRARQGCCLCAGMRRGRL